MVAGFCSDDDEKMNSYFTQRSAKYSKEEKVKNENPLLINSSVAFYLEEWDGFEHKTTACTPTSLALDRTQEHQQYAFQTERHLFNSNFIAFERVQKQDVGTEPGGIK